MFQYIAQYRHCELMNTDIIGFLVGFSVISVWQILTLVSVCQNIRYRFGFSVYRPMTSSAIKTVTVTKTVAPFYLSISSLCAALTTETKTLCKENKYIEMLCNYYSFPIASETFYHKIHSVAGHQIYSKHWLPTWDTFLLPMPFCCNPAMQCFANSIIAETNPMHIMPNVLRLLLLLLAPCNAIPCLSIGTRLDDTLLPSRSHNVCIYNTQ